MDKYYEILSSFGTHETLDPKIWDDVDGDTPKLKPQIRKALLMIAGEFMEFLGENLFVDDVRFTGSLANYNWSKFSDVDLHLYVDFNQFDEEDKEVYKELFQLKKTLFNTSSFDFPSVFFFVITFCGSALIAIYNLFVEK